MDPIPPNDPLWKLLGQSRRVEVRPNFTQNVLRAARQTPQERGWFARLRTWRPPRSVPASPGPSPPPWPWPQVWC